MKFYVDLFKLYISKNLIINAQINRTGAGNTINE